MPDGPQSPAGELLLATGNPHKIEEMRAILAPVLAAAGIRARTLADFPGIAEPEETGATFIENALLKARYYAEASGLWALADDSGLVIDALGGAPGVRSARYADSPSARIERVLRELADVSADSRAARFVCVAALSTPSGRAAAREGRIEGSIGFSPSGSGGFGYDPIFIPEDQSCFPHERTGAPSDLPEQPRRSLAEFPAAQKNRISHRGRALAAITPLIPSALRGSAELGEFHSAD